MQNVKFLPSTVLQVLKNKKLKENKLIISCDQTKIDRNINFGMHILMIYMDFHAKNNNLRYYLITTKKNTNSVSIDTNYYDQNGWHIILHIFVYKK